jgi:hypothetical protein
MRVGDRWLARLALPFLVLGAGALPGAPADEAPAKPVSFHKDIAPILARRCQGCHQPAKPGGKLDVTSHKSLLAGGRRGEGAVAGKPGESLLLQFLTGEKKPQMPKGEEPLPPAEIELFRRWIAAGAADDTPATARRAFDASRPPVYGVPPVVSALAFSPDGAHLAVAGYHEITLHKLSAAAGGAPESPREVRLERVARLVGLSDRLESIVFARDGSIMAAVGGAPGRFGEIQVWDPKEQKLLSSTTVGFDNLYGASLSDDGALLGFGGTDKSAQVFSIAEKKVLRRIDQHEDWVFGTGFSKDRTKLITASRDRTLKLIETETGSFIDNLTSITPGVLGGPLFALQRHPAEDKFVTGGEDGIPKLYKTERTAARQIGDDNNLLRAYERLPGAITCIAFDQAGKRIAAGCITGHLRIYDVESGARLVEAGGHGAVYTVAFHPDGSLFAAGGFDGKVRLYDTGSGSLLLEALPVPLGPVDVSRTF